MPKGIPWKTDEERAAAKERTRQRARERQRIRHLPLGESTHMYLMEYFAEPSTEFWARCWRAAIAAARAENQDGVVVALRALYGPVPSEATLLETFLNMVKGRVK